MKPRLVLHHSLLLLTGLCLASACSPFTTPTPFIPPTAPPQLIEPTLIIQPTPQVVVVQSTPLPTVIVPTPTIDPANCINNLTFIADLTIPDGTFFPYGATIDKQWTVQNSGTCNWDSRYSLRFIGGGALGATEVLPLYPAKPGTQATIQIIFTAPFTDGEYTSGWQAYDPNGQPFGDAFYLRVVVGSQ